MQQKIETFELKTVALIEGLTSAISGTWREPLIAEGFGRIETDANGYATAVNVQDELDSLLHYQKLMSFYEGDIDDLVNRERILVDYVRGFYSANTIARSIIPRKTFVPRVIKNISMLYKDQPTRTLMDKTGEEPEESKSNEAYQDIIKDARISIQSKNWHRLYKLNDLVCVKPTIRAGKLKYDIQAPNTFRVLIDDEGLVSKYLYSDQTTVETDGKLLTENIVVVWTDEEHYYRNANGEKHAFPENEDMENPYGQIPAVFMAKDECSLYSGGLYSLIEENLYVNYMGMLEAEDITFAAITIFHFTNIKGEKDTFLFNPRNPVQSETSIGVEAPPRIEAISGEPSSELINTLSVSHERNAALRQGMSPAMLSEEPQELSGKAQKIMMTELLEGREDDADVMEVYERQLYEITAIVWNTEDGTKGELPALDTISFSVNFMEVSFDDDPVVTYDLDIRKVKDGIMSVYEWAQKYDMDVNSEDEAIERVRGNKEQLSRLNAAGFSGFRKAATEQDEAGVEANAITGATDE